MRYSQRGKKPFADWLLDLSDERAQAKIRARIRRAAFGNFGDWKSLAGAKGIFEMRENYGPGYRIYYSIVGRKIILLLAGSTRRDQDRAIAKAGEYLADYERRVKKMKPSKPFSETSKKLLRDPKVAALYLEECLMDDDIRVFTAALKDVAEAQGGMASLSKATHLNREALYRTLSKGGNPCLDTLTKVLGAMGLRIGVVPVEARS